MPRVGPQASARALLDELMGSQRDLPESERREIRFDDPEIDKFWLVGLDPFSMFRNTPWATRLPEMYRRAVGRPWSGDPERRERPRGVREVWAEVPEEAKLKYGYEGELLAFLEELIKTNDRAVQRARLAHEAKASEITDADAEKVKAFDFEIDALTKQAEVAGENGEIDVSLNFMAKVDDLQKRKALVFKPNDVRVQKVLVCEVSGNVVQNTPVRIQEHYQGRIYLSWKSVRDKYAELQAKFHGAAPPRPVPGYDYETTLFSSKAAEKRRRRPLGWRGGSSKKTPPMQETPATPSFPKEKKKTPTSGQITTTETRTDDEGSAPPLPASETTTKETTTTTTTNETTIRVAAAARKGTTTTPLTTTTTTKEDDGTTTTAATDAPTTTTTTRRTTTPTGEGAANVEPDLPHLCSKKKNKDSSLRLHPPTVRTGEGLLSK
eukprot:CAMPEP_0118915226 /NCGR_PEP_ID=MMETSP1166-20130328/15433_1 /TAXON_ID=1104430 /ORGANISM="Chrysoreinhardia sp, Strain CCMP3193" /LENGTH=436 /DNA_ID=CAMNT_0006854889 /DNA_START=106 /DNA_END=1417 /DNA_ORIENTATION=-